jgi:digeranylgeranylglycerophospholipid reductase
MEEEYEIIVVGGGVAGSFAAATAADEGAEVVQLERKSEEEAGHIACGDAMKDPTSDKYYPGPIDMESLAEDPELLADNNVDQIEWRDEEIDVRKVIPYPGNGSNVVDRYVLGQGLLDETARLGVDQHFDTVVNGVVQDDQVRGVEAVRDGENVTYTGDLVIDAGGSLSTVMADTDFPELDAEPDTTLEEPHFTQYGSAYREIIETEDPVPYDNSIIGKPLEEMGYIWYFPRTPTEINVGLGFQMSEDPVQMPQRLAEDLEGRDEYEGAEIGENLGESDKLGAALALRRPLDSMVAPGYIAVGGNAGTTHPISGKGIRGAAVSGFSAGKHGAEAVNSDEDGFISEEDLWAHNHFLYADHGLGTRIASKDPYNIAVSQMGMDTGRATVALLPEEEIRETVSSEDTDSVDMGNVKNFLTEGAGNAWHHFRDGTFEDLGVSKREVLGTLHDFWKTKNYADEMRDHYSSYPDSREDFFEWLDERNRIDNELNQALGVPEGEEKY